MQEGVHLELNPLGTRGLLGMPAAELGGRVVDLRDLGPPRLATLPERLAATTGWSRRFAVLDDVLRAELTEAGPPVPEVTAAWRRLLATGGTARTSALADQVGWSRRHLGERFRRELGLTPKQAARVIRFERACALLWREATLPLAELAVACGYYDQAHLTNEWRALAGCSPGTWLAEELPFLQAEPGAPARDCAHD
ncbi:Helix-turn-helix domain-containing protein [Amycolatopsis arida]|uniref:Helix-turn-helix domain-containing protein n=1 Tax=Amycolatopsis arida TaxID=587909 RepID=A0A1I5KJK6_9PSEU|nr:helix-turn-helix protein [Amycolatopsis arida]SFO85264.1 Helix-turn-helix domain-containing protein [Amycolatopsis arida]